MPAETDQEAATVTEQNPAPIQSNKTTAGTSTLFGLEFPATDPWPEPVTGKELLDGLELVLRRFVVLPEPAPSALALWILHTYAFQLREVSAYLGIESPEKRCGKTTLLTVLLELVHRPIVAANISSPAFFRLIAEARPTLLIDEADTLLQGNDELRGILNSGYTRKTAYVVRVAQQVPASPLALARFSCWCPKVMAAIGRLPDTLADRCIIIPMQRKTAGEKCERLRALQGTTLRRQCARFVLDHAEAITAAHPELPEGLNDRAGDIWEPLLILADLAGGDWPQRARQAALQLSAGAPQNGPIVALLLDVLRILLVARDHRLFSRLLVLTLNKLPTRNWTELTNGKPITELELAQQLRPYRIHPKNLRIATLVGKGYVMADFIQTIGRYVPQSDFDSLASEMTQGLVQK